MSLLYHKQNQELSSGVRLIQDVNASNSPMKYTAVKVLEFSADSSYEETLEAFEAGIVVLEGKVTITADDQTFEDVGQRTSIFDKIPTDSVYVSTGLAFGIRAKQAAKILIAYAPTNQTFPVRLIRGNIHQVEHRGKYNNKRLVQNILPPSLQFKCNTLTTRP
nr:5-deoxy-glucuronate isomerase [Lacticaseibacillus paracasei]